MKINTKEMVLTALFTALTVAGAKLNLMLPNIPVTLQTAIVMLAGCIGGKKVAFLSQVLYIVAGLIGIPVFAMPDAGPAYVLKPSFGYIIGFTAAAYIIGLIIEKSRKSIISFIAANMAGIAVIYFFGVIYIYLLMNLYMGKHINMLKAISIGLAPFIIKDIIIAFVLSFICRKIYFTLKNTAHD